MASELRIGNLRSNANHVTDAPPREKAWRARFEYPWARDDNGELPKMSTDRCDAFLAAARMSKDDDEIMRLVEDGWAQACRFVRQHEDAIRSFAAWLSRVSELSGIECEIFWNLIFPHIKNPPTTRATSAALPRREVDLGLRPYIVRSGERVDGWC
jgi:hypothetical protein